MLKSFDALAESWGTLAISPQKLYITYFIFSPSTFLLNHGIFWSKSEPTRLETYEPSSIQPSVLMNPIGILVSHHQRIFHRNEWC